MIDLGWAPPSPPCMVLRNPLCSQLGLFVEFSPEDVLLGVEEAEGRAGTWRQSCWLSLWEAGTAGRKPALKGQGEFATVGAGTRWLRQVVGRAFPHSCGQPARSPGPSGVPVATNIPSERPSCSAHLPVCCVGGAHSFLGYTSHWTVRVSGLV